MPRACRVHAACSREASLLVCRCAAEGPPFASLFVWTVREAVITHFVKARLPLAKHPNPYMFPAHAGALAPSQGGGDGKDAEYEAGNEEEMLMLASAVV